METPAIQNCTFILKLLRKTQLKLLAQVGLKVRWCHSSPSHPGRVGHSKKTDGFQSPH